MSITKFDIIIIMLISVLLFAVFIDYSYPSAECEETLSEVPPEEVNDTPEQARCKAAGGIIILYNYSHQMRDCILPK
jgi:hypothetical protein